MTYELGRKQHPKYEDGRAQHMNSVTGQPGAMAYEDDRAQHTNSVTQQPGAKAKAYETGRKQHKKAFSNDLCKS